VNSGSHDRRSVAVALLGAAVLALGLLSPAAVAAYPLVPLPGQPEGVPWPTAEWPEGALPAGLDRASFDGRVAELFEGRGRSGVRDTRALLIVQGGRLVFERYAEGFGRESRFQSWSMAKSVTNAFAGVLVREGRLDVSAPADVPEWSAADDPRRAITLGHLLEMRSGLGNGDGFGNGDLLEAFISRLMFGEGATSPAAYSAGVPLVAPVGIRWAYSTGSSVLIASICGRVVGGGAERTRDFLRDELFRPIGMKSAQPEFAASGEFIGGAFMHANARDWARFGYLYLRDGSWDGRRILPEGWVDYSRTPNPAENNRTYGAHFWVNAAPVEGQWQVLPGAPESTFAAEGAYFQMVAIVPSLDLVVVRLGETFETPFEEAKATFGALVATFGVLDAAAPQTGAAQ
jgi:CubicO group peptidase (beta-lactamase class C family)